MSSAYIVELAYVRTAEDIDWRDVDADSRVEAEAVARTLFARESYGSLRDAQIISVTAQRIPERRYRLNLGSDADDLGVEEVAQ